MNSYKKRCPDFILKYLLHSDLLWNEPELFIKAQCAFVASPDVQGQIVAATFLCEIANKAVKLFADMKPAAALVNAKIVNIESFYVGQDIAVFVADKNAKGIADNGVGFVNGDEYRARIIGDYCEKLAVCIFLCVSFEYIGAKFDISAATLRKFNDLSSGEQPKGGMVIYIERKASRWEGDELLHTVVEGETLHDIAQLYGIRLVQLSKMNRTRATTNLKAGQTIRIK